MESNENDTKLAKWSIVYSLSNRVHNIMQCININQMQKCTRCVCAVLTTKSVVFRVHLILFFSVLKTWNLEDLSIFRVSPAKHTHSFSPLRLSLFFSLFFVPLHFQWLSLLLYLFLVNNSNMSAKVHLFFAFACRWIRIFCYYESNMVVISYITWIINNIFIFNMPIGNMLSVLECVCVYRCAVCVFFLLVVKERLQ